MSDPTDKDLPDEQQLDEYLKGGSSVSRQYSQLRSADVPAELDRLVLRQAHDAVQSTRPAKSRTWMRWTAPLALAASAVLVVSIVIESGVSEKEVMLSAPAPAAAPTEPQRPFVPPSEVAESDTAATSAYVASPQAKAEIAPPPPPKLDVPSADEMRRERRIAPARQAVANNSASREPERLSVNTRSLKEAEQALAAHGMTTTTIQQSADVRPAAAPAPAPEFAADAAADAEEEKSQALQQYSDPELWLRDIRQLRRENKKELADKEWRRFREAFPNHQVEENDTAREVK